jgi:hypothetical protein
MRPTYCFHPAVAASTLKTSIRALVEHQNASNSAEYSVHTTSHQVTHVPELCPTFLHVVVM